MKYRLCALLLALAGCGPLVTRPQQPVQHDLGSVRVAQAIPIPLLDIEVRAPSWLDSTAMHYRLAYESDTRRDVYAQSRWAAPPSEMLWIALRRLLDAPDAGSASSCRLRVEVDEFIQHFDRVDSARGLIAGRALLIDTRGHRVLARLPFSISEAATGADASGGVTALSRSIDVLGVRLASWLNSPVLKDMNHGC